MSIQEMIERTVDNETLLKYSNPLMIIDPDGQKTNLKFPGEIRSKLFQCQKTEEEVIELQLLLNSLLPPIEWEEEGAVWQLQVSTEPVSRFDVIKLKETLDLWLKQRQARSRGICSVRREIFIQLFDEMIRQETIICPERGMLLIRMRDEHRMSLASVQALYEGSISYAKSKALEAEDSILPLLKEVEEARQQRDKILNEVKIMEDALNQATKRGKELLLNAKKRQAEQLELLNNTNMQLKCQLDELFYSKR
ncbi:33 kDa inner dynein arm light chain, axonemal-like [Cimex lectularius]|uniref:33 kDa inner dynein arm light chain, axonemal n=1 Tax=Cimex lectularius TaxID=79782 RepID=A0A8I6SBH5_CIMLE|nr:33 kDa inner dynein arm light chain, axonemal-like [Cimex lectularius]